MEKETSDLLKLRAIEMAKEPKVKTETAAFIQLITFELGTETYGIESVFIREVLPLKEYTPLPGVASYILGIINVRGQIIPVVDLKKFFNLPEMGLTELNKVIILRDEQMEFGILADVVNGRQGIGIDEIKPVPPTVSEIGQEFLLGVTKERLIVLNAEKLLTDKSIIVNDELA